MPGMNGAVLATRIKGDPSIQKVVFIMLTSIGHWKEVRAVAETSVDACLVKPVRSSQLMNTLATAWAKQQSAGSSPDTSERFTGSLAALKSNITGRFTDSHLRALVAEDNAANQTVAVRMLARLGVHADVAGNGREAIEMVRMLPYDVVFMDCQMPEMDGYEATAEIRHREGPDRHVTIIALTAEAISGCREQCLAAGMDDFIAKPISLNDLIEVFEKTNYPAPRTGCLVFPAVKRSLGSPGNAPWNGRARSSGAPRAEVPSINIANMDLRSKSSLDIRALLEAGKLFRRKLQAIKDAATDIAWYPYDSLASLDLLDQVLTGDSRRLSYLSANEPVLDIGCGDGDLSFLMESLGFAVHALDYAPNNFNGMRGVAFLKRMRSTRVFPIHSTDLDAALDLPQGNFGLVLLLGVIYHLKNPLGLLAELAHRTSYCILSTRTMQLTPDKRQLLQHLPTSPICSTATN